MTIDERPEMVRELILIRKALERLAEARNPASEHDSLTKALADLAAAKRELADVQRAIQASNRVLVATIDELARTQEDP
jgi:hypothetical protein